MTDEMKSKIYDIIKWAVITVSPALVAFITGLGELYGFNAAVITGTISLTTAFIGACLQISSKSYHKAQAQKNAQDQAEVK